MKEKIARKIVFILVLIMGVCSLSACKKHVEGKVGEAVVTFIGNYYFDNEFDDGISMCEKEAYDAAVKEAEDLKMCFTEEELKSMAEGSNFETFNVKTEEMTINGNTADVKLVIKMPNEEITRWNYKLEKIDDKWKIVSFAGDYNKPNEEKVAENILAFTNNYYTYYRFGKVTPSEELRINNPHYTWVDRIKVALNPLWDRFGKITPSEESRINNSRYTWGDKIKIALNPLCKGDVCDTILKEVGDLKGYFSEEEIESFAEKAKSETVKIQIDKIVVRWDKAGVRLSAQIPGEEVVNWEYKLEKIEGVWKIVSASSDYKKSVNEFVNSFVENCYINYDFDKARLVSTDEVCDIIKNEVDNLKTRFTDEEIHKMAEDMQVEVIVLIEDKAIVKSTLSLADEEIVNWEYKLEKIDGEWRITEIKGIDAQ